MWLIIASFITLIIIYYKWAFGYWKRKKVPYLQPKFLVGNMNPDIAHYYNYVTFYNTMKNKGCKHAGYYTFFKPVYIPIDLEYVKMIMIKDFNAFNDHGIDYGKSEPFARNLFTMKGLNWKELRNELTPSFSTGKLRQYVELITKCAEGMRELLEKTEEPVDVKEACVNLSVDVIGSCGFGIDCQSFKEIDAEFRKHCTLHFDMPYLKMLRILAIFLFPQLISFFGSLLVDKNSSVFFLKTIKKVLQYREDSGYRRNDMMQTFIDLEKTHRLQVTPENIAGHIYSFFVAGHETVATTTSFALFEMAKNKRIQEKVRNEIAEVLEKHDGQITYESLLELKYTDQVIDETLRRYPPAPAHFRRTTTNFQLPDTGTVIEKGTHVVIPLFAIHNDPDYFKDPHVFDPERFSPENKSKILPMSYLPFGLGPRMCIAIKFAYIEIKITLITAIKDFEISLNPKTPATPEWESNCLVLRNKHAMLLDFERINK